MKTTDTSKREMINANIYTIHTKRKSKLIPAETLVQEELKITCPKCKIKHWYGSCKRHNCKNCNIWIMYDYVSFGVGGRLYVSLTKEGLGMTNYERTQYKLKQQRKEKKDNEKS